jgi:steroid delta-isomerase-like uncharacterized protein
LNYDARSLVQRLYDALNRRDFDALDEIVSPDLLHHSLPGMTGRDGLKRTLIGYYQGFPDLNHSVEDVVVEADRVAVRTHNSGTHLGSFLGHAPSGRRFSATALSLYRIDGGVIREIWEVFDTVAMLQQIGLYSLSAASFGNAGASGSRAVTDPPGSAKAGRRPPGPVAEVSLADIRSDPLTFLGRLTHEHGDYVRYVCEGRETILLNQPKAIRHVLHDRVSNYSKDNTPDLLLLKPMLGDGLLTTIGPVWKQDRHWIQPVLARQIDRAGDLMVKVIEAMLARWRMRPDPDATIDIVPEMSRLTLEIAARVLFSSDFASYSRKFGEAMDVLNESMSQPRPDRPEVQRHFQPALALIRSTVWQVILSRKFYDSGEDDLLGSLLRSQGERGDTDQHIVDQAITILLAGHETTAKALSWAIILLDKNPEALARLHSELANCLNGRLPGVHDLPDLPYTRAVINEAMRIYPPIWLLTRTALQDDEIAGFAIPRGALVAISPYLIHRHSDFWEQPQRFAPERFLGDQNATQAYRYLPFGHGPRHCVGRSFALLEMPLVLATVYSQFALKSAAGYTPEPEALVTLRPRHGLPMTITARREDSMQAVRREI